MSNKHSDNDSRPEGQVRMAEALVKLYGDQLMYVPGMGWYVWNGTYWQHDSLGQSTQLAIRVVKRAKVRAAKLLADADILEADRGDHAEVHRTRARGERLMQAAKSCMTAPAVRGIKELAATYPQIAVAAKELNPDPFLINMTNCTVNLRSEESKPHDPADRITAVCNAGFSQERVDSFDPEIDCPQWHKFICEVLPDAQVRNFFQDVVGSALAGEQFSHDVPIWRGGGRNGKGVTEETLRHVFGPDYSMIAPYDLFTSKPGAHTTSQANLMGRRFVVVDEQDGNAQISEALLKKISGGGDITARKMKQDDVTFHQTWLTNVIANELPNITGQGAAIWERLLIIEFPRTFTREQQETNLRFDLKDEADGIFMWMFVGWRRFQARGRKLIVPDPVRSATQRYRRKCDHVERWLDIWCERGTTADFRVKPRDLLESFNKWASVLPGNKSLSKNEFKKLMQDKGFRYESSRAVFHGLKLRAEAFDSDPEDDPWTGGSEGFPA